jgi:imidazole glycerol-phosphate synthase subunit HisH
MSAPEVTVIDYGVGNLLSVRRGLEFCGARVTVTSDPAAILASSHVVLPGVGAFGNAMAALHKLDMPEVIREVAARGKPFLGICLGMQLLLDESEEFEITPGLGLIHGRVIPVPSATTSGSSQKIPHIGWSALFPAGGRQDWRDTLLENVQPRERVYFVHSFMAAPAKAEHRIADCFYGGQPVSAVIGRDNISGCPP